MRDLFLNNIWLKLFSLVMATLIWLTVQATLDQETRAAYQTAEPADDWEGLALTEKWFSLPVAVEPKDSGKLGWIVTPAQVTVTIRGEKQKMRVLKAEDLRAFVDLSGNPMTGVPQPVQVITPPSIHCIRIIPPLISASAPKPALNP